MATRLNQRAAPEFPLLTRPPDAAMFRRPDGPITTAAFLGAVHRVAPVLPAARYVVNLCRDRYRFTVALAAALMRHQVMLLAGDRSRTGCGNWRSSIPASIRLSTIRRRSVRCRIVWCRSGAVRLPTRSRASPPTSSPRLASHPVQTGHPSAHHKPWGALVARSIDAARRLQLYPGAIAVMSGWFRHSICTASDDSPAAVTPSRAGPALPSSPPT